MQPRAVIGPLFVAWFMAPHERRETVGFMDDAKETAKAMGEKVKDTWEDTTDRIGDKVDEMKAESEVKKAEAERDSVKTRNDIKEDLRDN